MTAAGSPAVTAPSAPTIAEQLEAEPRQFEPGRDEAILAAVAEGTRLSGSDALYLFEYGDLERVGAAADAARRRKHPDNRATFIIDRNINYTNVCVARCSFCAFYRLPRHAEGYRRSKEEIFRRIEEALDMGATQIMFQGGHDPELKIDYYEDLLSSVKQRYPVTLHSLGPPEVLHIARVSHLTVPVVLRRLRRAGLDSLPGAGAEILVQRVRQEVSPFKSGAEEWLEVMEEAHRQHIRTTATMTFGMVETYAERVEHFQRIRDVQDKADPRQGFRAFIPFIYQPGNTELGGRATSIADYLRTLAISRLFLDNFYSLQGSWLTTGTAAARSSLEYGADDLGSIMLEENVVRATGLDHGMTDHAMVQLIRECRRIPALRDTHYRIIATYA
ncbi:MAG: dehypoxanthine futalosine cyclase [Dehalococcoidia bacterium]|nr:dehypoxanthine futalosine cyclase [Dehalococcoidia bacterium]